MIEAGVFDVDGLLFRTDPAGKEAARLAVSKLKSKALRAKSKGTGLTPADMSIPEVPWFAGKPMREQSGPLVKQFGLKASQEELRALWKRYFRGLVGTGGRVQPMPGAVEALEMFDGIPLGIASGGELPHILNLLNRHDLRKKFQVIISGESRRPKPAPDIYLAAAEALKVRPENCAAFDDSPDGVAAAVAAGMKVVAVRSSFTMDGNFEGAVLILNSLSELTPEMIKSL